MFVVKRDGRKEDVKFDKITSRINKLCYGLDSRFVDSIKISQKVRAGKRTPCFFFCFLGTLFIMYSSCVCVVSHTDC